MNKKDAWIRCYKGGKVYFFEPERSEIDIEDISHALSLICRYNGSCREFYSVAQHSVIVSLEVYRETESHHLAFQGLMHDASESFISDIPRPFKTHFEGYLECEKRFERWLAERFSYTFPYHPVVKEHDMRCLVTEMRDFMKGDDYKNIDATPYSHTIIPWSPRVAKGQFTLLYNSLCKKINK